MSKKLTEVIPQILFEFGMTAESDRGPFIDRSQADYKELLGHSDEFSKWHRNIYICELIIIFFICVLSLIDLTLFGISSTRNFWCAHRFSIFFGFISVLTFVIFLHAFVDLLQYKLFNCINLDTGDKNIIDKFNLFKQHKNNISSNMNRIFSS
ncbi:MAG: hypothetical protein HZA28_03570 [Candidatus Omnitrophica bacterium]|nr:hypothetical protein [Candidatus Omnitrophota bacterium]